MPTQTMKAPFYHTVFKSDVPALILFPFLTVAATVLCAVVTLLGILSCLDRTGHWPHAVSRIWAQIMMWLLPIKVQVLGRENMAGGPFVFVCNHLSMLDNIFVLACLHSRVRFSPNRKYFKYVPSMYMARYIPIDTNKPAESRQRLLKEGGAFLHQGISMVIFPEGMRSPDGKLKAFKTGAFELAIKNRVKILPVVIQGSFGAMAKGSVRLNLSEVSIHILQPLHTDDLQEGDIGLLRDRTHDEIAKKLEVKP